MHPFCSVGFRQVDSHLPDQVLHEILEQAAAVDAGLLHAVLVHKLDAHLALQRVRTQLSNNNEHPLHHQ